MHKKTAPTLPYASGSFWSSSFGCLCMRTAADSETRDPTLRAIRMAMKMEQIGSAMNHPKRCISTADTITPTLPRVSARMCRKT